MTTIPLQSVETDEQILARIGTDPEQWAKAYARMPFYLDNPERRELQLMAWFHHAIEAGRKAGPRG